MLQSRRILVTALMVAVLGVTGSVRADDAQGHPLVETEGQLFQAAGAEPAERPEELVTAQEAADEPADPARRTTELRKRIAVLAAMAKVAQSEQMPEVAQAVEQRARELQGELRESIVALGQKGAAQKRELRQAAEQLRERARQLQDQARELEAQGKAEEAIAAKREAAKLTAQVIALEAKAAEMGGWAEVALSLRQLADGQAALRKEVQEMHREMDALRARVSALEG